MTTKKLRIAISVLLMVLLVLPCNQIIGSSAEARAEDQVTQNEDGGIEDNDDGGQNNDRAEDNDGGENNDRAEDNDGGENDDGEEDNDGEEEPEGELDLEELEELLLLEELALAANADAVVTSWAELIDAIQEAIDNWQSGSEAYTISFSGNETLSGSRPPAPGQIVIPSGIKIRIIDDGSDSGVTFKKSFATPLITVENGAELTMEETATGSFTLDLDNRQYGTAGYGWLFHVEGTLNINGGTITNCGLSQGGGTNAPAGVILARNNGVINLNGGTITDNKINHSATYCSGIVVAYNGGSLHIRDDAVIENTRLATASYGTVTEYDEDIQAWKALNRKFPIEMPGAAVVVFTNGSTTTFTMEGGVIRNNQGATAGGIYIADRYDNRDLTYVIQNINASITGGIITGNTCVYGGGAGGISTKCYGLNLELGCVEISHNQGNSGGVGLQYANHVTINGADISHNRAVTCYEETGNGGGIFVNWYVHGADRQIIFNSAVFEGNEARVGTGGGIYFEQFPPGRAVSDKDQKDFHNFIVYNNQAVARSDGSAGSGGGIYSCPSSGLEMMTVGGMLAFDNTAANSGDDFYVHHSEKSVTISNWSEVNGDLFYSDWYQDDEGNRYTRQTNPEPVSDLDLIGLSTDLGFKAIADCKAEDLNTSGYVVITQNSAAYGGGIGNNGVLTSDSKGVKITYDPNGGNGRRQSEAKLLNPDRASFDIFSNEEVTKYTHDGFTFAGWSIIKGDQAGDPNYAPGTKIDLDEDLTLYAIWVPKVVEPIKITYKPNGGSGSDVIDSIMQNAPYVIRTLESTLIRYDGFIFQGWSTDPNDTAQEPGFEPNKTITRDTDLTLYAIWQKNSDHSKDPPDPKTTTPAPDPQPEPEPESLLNRADHFAYIIGYPNGTVQPTGNITRAEVATIYFRLLTNDVRNGNLRSTNPFGDVNIGQWYNTAISTLQGLGIVSGYPDGSFRPNEPITRAELAVIAVRFDVTNARSSDNFSDTAGHWAEDSIRRAVTLGWVEGYPDGSFRPDTYITRAEMMTLTNRVLERHINSDDDMVGEAVLWPDNPLGAWYYYEVEEATNSHDYDRKGTDYEEQWTKLNENRDWTVYER